MSDKIRDQIREIFLRNGFTIKEGQADLKPYVYAAAEELLQAALAEQPASGVYVASRRGLVSAFAKQPATAAPEGWKTVPIKPSIEMVEAGYEASLGQPDRSGHARTIEAYDSMLAAAPAAPVAVQEPVACEYRTFYDENTSTPGWSKWERIEPQGRYSHETVESRVAEIQSYIDRGYRYELRALYTAPPAAEQPHSTTSDQYRAELYDEVWEKARGMGYGNVTEALVALERIKAGGEA